MIDVERRVQRVCLCFGEHLEGRLIRRTHHLTRQIVPPLAERRYHRLTVDRFRHSVECRIVQKIPIERGDLPERIFPVHVVRRFGLPVIHRILDFGVHRRQYLPGGIPDVKTAQYNNETCRDACDGNPGLAIRHPLAPVTFSHTTTVGRHARGVTTSLIFGALVNTIMWHGDNVSPLSGLHIKKQVIVNRRQTLHQSIYYVLLVTHDRTPSL